MNPLKLIGAFCRIFPGIPILLALIWVTPASMAQNAPTLEGCPVLPADNIWNTPVDHLPVHPNSDAFIATMGSSLGLHPDFGSGTWNGAPIGIPYTVVDATQPKTDLFFTYADESDPGPYPIPPGAPIEGGDQSTGDRHVLVLDRSNCRLYEVFAATPNPNGTWDAGSGAVYDLRSNDLRPEGWTSADAAGLPILPGLARYDEVATGKISHALRFTAPQTRREYIWPARHYASSLTAANYPPLGLRLRLKADFDISGFSPEIRVILQTLKEYGMILADNGSAWYISGTPDPGWDNDALRELKQVTGSEFEVVDVSALMVDPDSGQAAQISDPVDSDSPAPDESGGSGNGTSGGGCFVNSLFPAWHCRE